MCQAEKCESCKKRLSHNNKIGFCTECTPKEKVIALFRKGKTITNISKIVFNSTLGYYRGNIRAILKEKISKEEFITIKNSNRNKVMRTKRLELPLGFISELYNKGKCAPEIHKALISKGYKLHIATLHKRLKELGFDLMVNANKRKVVRQRISIKRKRTIKELWLDGNSIKDISRATGMAENTIKVYLHQMGFKTKLFQNYVLKNYTEDERDVKTYLERKGFNVKKCYFLCQRKNKEGIIVPKELKGFCQKCPVKNLKFKHREFYDFILEKKGVYSIAEVKKTYVSKNWERAHFSLGQFMNLPEILKNNIPFHLIVVRGEKFEETIF